jgi:hypothetical protein
VQLIAESVEIRGTRPLEEIDSYKTEGALTVSSVEANVLAKHKPHIGIVSGRGSGNGRRRSGKGPRTLNLSCADETIEVRDRRRLDPMCDGKDMENFCTRAERLNSPWYRLRGSPTRGALGEEKACAAHNACRSAEKAPPRQRALPKMPVSFIRTCNGGWRQSRRVRVRKGPGPRERLASVHILLQEPCGGAFSHHFTGKSRRK